jgi:hypothetical protein
MAAVVITRQQAIEKASADALTALPFNGLTRDKRVAVNPNETWASAEDTTGVTRPDTLRAVLQQVKQHGPCGPGRQCADAVFSVTGWMSVEGLRDGEFAKCIRARGTLRIPNAVRFLPAASPAARRLYQTEPPAGPLRIGSRRGGRREGSQMARQRQAA